MTAEGLGLRASGLGPQIMGVVNATPDSFSDGYPGVEAAVEQGLRLLADGADIVDVGGEATNPWATPIDAAEELRRVLPVVARLVAAGATVSIDTTKAEVARAAVAAGARIVNDISGGLFDPAIRGTVAGVTYICGHLRGRSIREVFAEENRPVTWQEVAAELAARIAELPQLPQPATVWADPGLGFGKGSDPATNEALIAHAGDLAAALGCPVVIGASRKRFLRRRLIERGIAEPTEADLDAATVAASLDAARAGASVLRVHNVALLRTALTAYNQERLCRVRSSTFSTD